MKFLIFLNNNSGAIQAISMAILIFITFYYAFQTKKQADLLKHQEQNLSVPKIKFTAKEIFYWAPENEPKRSKIDINFSNIGLRDIKIISLGYFSNEGTFVRSSFEELTLPKILKPGDAIRASIDINELKDPLLFELPEDEYGGEFKGFFCEDATGEIYECKFELKN